MSNKPHVLFTTKHTVENDVAMSATIRKRADNNQYQWIIAIGIDKDEPEMISFRGNAKSVKECMIRIRAFLLGLDDTLQDVLADVKQYVLEEYIDTDTAILGDDDDAEFK